jgi:hypothetical protein
MYYGMKLLVGATRNYASTVLLWNIALDQNGGPKKDGGCSMLPRKTCALADEEVLHEQLGIRQDPSSGDSAAGGVESAALR